jgi:hypothetical protein
LLLPLWTEHQPYANAFGALALYLIAVIVVSSYYKDKIKTSGMTHVSLPVLLCCGASDYSQRWTDPKLEDQPIDWFDAEKIFVLLCCSVIAGLSVYRFAIVKRSPSN